MHKGIATVSLSGSLEDKLAAIGAAGFDGAEIFDGDLVACPLSPAEIRQRCADLGFSIDLYQPIRDVEGHLPERFPAVLHRFRRKLQVAQELGVGVVLACSNVAPNAVDDRDLSAEQLAALAQAAEEAGIVIAFEALAWGTNINRVGQAWDLVRTVDHPHLQLAVDTFHLLARQDDASALADVPGERIGFLQVADAPVLEMDVLQWSRHHRVFPGQGGLDVVPVVAATLEAGYTGPVSLEIFSDVVREADPRVNALDGLRSLLHLEEALRRRWDVAAPPARPRVELLDCPPAPAVIRPAFVDISAAAEFEKLLSALGFTAAGRRRDGVVWWANGAAHILLRDTDGTPAVTGYGLAVDDVAAFAARRAAYLWPDGPQTLSPPVETVQSPAGIGVSVVAMRGPGDWRAGFDRIPETGPTAAGPGWGELDHLDYRVGFDVSEAEISFQRFLFGLLPGSVSEFIDPHGRMRSRMLRAPLDPATGREGDFRIGLTMTAGDYGTTFGGLAFGCSDVLAAASRLRAAGVELLDVPDNYYADLDARFDLDPGFLATLRDLGVLYDRDDDGGELLHLYTRRIADAFDIELVQRSGGYDGYGSAATPVRLAAQAAQSSGGS